MDIEVISFIDGISSNLNVVEELRIYNKGIRKNKYYKINNENIKIRTPNEIIESTLTNMNIEIYLNCTINNDGTYELSSKQAITNNQLSINTKRLYAKVPLQKYSIIGIQFDVS